MEILTLLNQHFGEYQRSTHKAGHENYLFFCPFCMHKKKKLEVDVVSGYWHCWVCNAKGRTLYSLFKRRKVSKTILDTLRGRSLNVGRNTKPQAASNERLQLPLEYIPLWTGNVGLLRQVALNYLTKRGITKNDIERYKIGFCESGRYADSIIIPNYDGDGILNYFVGRSFRNWSEVNYKGPSTDKNIIGFESLISWNFPVVLVEGPFDAIAVRRNAIPLYGKTIRQKLKEKIVEEYPPELIIAVDPDAKKELLEISEYFSNFGIPTKIVDLKDKDPAEWGFKKFWEMVETNSKPFNYTDAFSEKIKMML